MRLPVAIAAALLLLPVAACGDEEDQPAGSRTPSPTSSATTTTPAPTADAPQSSADLELAPGRIGPITVGTTQDEAVASGLFDSDVTNDADCTFPLAWKEQFAGVDVFASADGTITSLGATEADGPRTADGLGVGSTVGELIETYGGDLSAPEEAGYGQVGVFVRDGDAWLGLLIGEATTIEQFDNDPGLEVTFAEATEGEKPGLMRDGC